MCLKTFSTIYRVYYLFIIFSYSVIYFEHVVLEVNGRGSFCEYTKLNIYNTNRKSFRIPNRSKIEIHNFVFGDDFKNLLYLLSFLYTYLYTQFKF